MSVLVLGSLNMDLVVTVQRLPQVGETLMGHEFFSAFGGKGANQAVALAKLRIPTQFIGKVGNDDFGPTLRLALQATGVDITGLGIDLTIHSGVASIVVTAQGENTIACAPGANGMVGEAELAYLKSQLPHAQWLLTELGIPLETVMRATTLAQEEGIPVLLDPSPAPPELPLELYRNIDILTPNEVEASQLAGFPVRDRDSAQAAARQFREWGVTTAIITLGERGVWCSSPEGEFWLPAPHVQVVDTVAAGDAFNGALIAALYAHESLETALRWGVTAGTLSVMQAGAQNSLPDRDLLLKSLSQFGFPNSAV